MESIKKLTGTIEAIGESVSVNAGNPSKNIPRVKKYDYVRFVDSSDQVRMLKVIHTIGPSVDSYIVPGQQGIFYFVELDDYLLLIAFSCGERKSFDLNELEQYHKQFKDKLKLANIATILGIPMIVIGGLGLVVMGIGIYQIAKAQKPIERTNLEYLTKYLGYEGFSI
jgi:hypothetical protein